MFGIFKKQKNELPIAEAMKKAEDMTTGEFGVILMYEKEVLFQIIKSKYFKQYGFQVKQENSFAELHFFNKNKTITNKYHSKLKEDEKANEFFYFENPIGNHSYIKELGNDFKQIEKKAKSRITELYQLSEVEIILRIDYE